eukprot:CAMPEP_0178545144 /NCGR_PEP_ID=MMETSP0697-20121206/3489_1 /TAXON_ID=265572 /ORGANISM="Extubocellulus spinifer, Strain CCMP396" /LENGTH=509 /DNA_ID=CAMNT_0020177699 /DNA_START=1631 /DNA_END=3156 /DNA_ORIENTATION=-
MTLPEAVDGRSHSLSVAALCTCTFVQAYLLISIFPYAGYMSIDLIPALTEENAGTYAGLLASAFMAGRTISAYPWGVVADTYGRKPALIWSLLTSAAFSIMFGMSKSFTFALVSRFLLGFCNSIQSTSKTTVTEIAKGDEKLEARGTGIAIGMRGVGFLLSPAIGGLLSDPVKQFPQSALATRFESTLIKCPFLLPNLVGFLLCLISAFSVEFFVDETLPEGRRRDAVHCFGDACRGIGKQFRCIYERAIRRTCVGRLSPQADGHAAENLLLTNQHAVNTDGTVNGVEEGHGSINSALEEDIREEDEESMNAIWRRQSTREHLVAYWLFSFVVVAVDEAFPLYCISRHGGLSLTEASIGKILSAAGVIFVLGQYYAFASLVDRLGLYKALSVGALLGVPITALIPLANLMNSSSLEDEINISTTAFLVVLMGVAKIFTCLFFAGITIATNRTVPASLRAKTNGLSMVGGSISKGLGPIFAGLLVALSFSVPNKEVTQYGALFIWSTIGA